MFDPSQYSANREVDSTHQKYNQENVGSACVHNDDGDDQDDYVLVDSQ